ncbi:glutamate 5-kinase [Candidatus Uhrbacteria bacterium]|nr:glutamate 5-kinase [Candidatus Uhrbacteria bacterium]
MSKQKISTIVIKIGTGVITTDDGFLDESMIKKIVDQVVALKKKGVRVVLVSSGAVAAGRALVKPPKKLNRIEKRQVLAAVGQGKLIAMYEKYLSSRGFHSAQVLATKEDFRDRHHYLNMRSCLYALLDNDVIPVINENDVVSVDELMFTDNDELAGLVASLLDVERLIILSTVDGVLDSEGCIISVIDTHEKLDHIEAVKSAFGRGGMITKVAVAKRLAKIGITTHILNGKQTANIARLIEGENIGTTFLTERRVSSNKKWLALARGTEHGVVTINSCAENLFRDSGKAMSLLPVGIVFAVGDFKKGEIIKIINESGLELGYGRADYSVDAINKVLGKKNQKPFVHYDYLFLDF